MLHTSTEMLNELGLSAEDAKGSSFLKVFTGNEILPDTNPYAMCYGGHQFGNWAGQLGDGRAINLCEVEHDTINLEEALSKKKMGPKACSEGFMILKPESFLT